MPLHLASCGSTGMKKMIDICGVPVHYTISGEGNTRILLLHGWGCDSSLMKPVADGLKDHYRILVPDFPGHGKSGRPPEPWGVPEYAECLFQLLQNTDFIPCHVVAHSFGCRIATWLASTHPELFGKMIFTGAAGILPMPSEKAKRRSARYKRLQSFCLQAAKIPFLKETASGWKEKLRQKYGSRDYNALDEEMRKTFVKVINLDLTELYKNIHSSTLLIWGDADTETPLWMGREMEKRIPDAGLVLFEGGSHFAYLEQIVRFNTIIRQFLKEEE